jgi:hypothetical protein
MFIGIATVIGLLGICQFPGVVDTAAEDIHTFHPRFSTHPRTQILGHPSVSFM